MAGAEILSDDVASFQSSFEGSDLQRKKGTYI